MVMCGALLLGAVACSTPTAPHGSDGALVLDGEGWAVIPDRGDRADLVAGGERTFSVWVRYTRPMFHAKILAKMNPPEDSWQGWATFVHQYNTALGLWHRASVPFDDSGFPQKGTAGTLRVGDGAWHHVALVQRDTVVEGWVDGKLEFVESISATLPQLDNDAPFWVGWNGADAIRFAGEMDELTVWSRALSGREIRRLMYARPEPGEPGLEGYWPMDDPDGDVLRDHSGNGWDGQALQAGWAPATRPLAPPFRDTPGFLVLAGLLAGALLYGVIRLYTRRLVAEKETLERKVEERVQDLARTNAEKDRALALVASQAERLEELDRDKRRFFANVSHEFRTPLSLIVGPLSDTLGRASGLDAEGARAVQTALRSAHRLSHLTGQLLDLARLETGVLKLEERPVDVAALVGELADSFGVAAEREGVILGVTIPAGAVVVSGDPHRLETVFTNLLANAMRFTPAGKRVLVTVSADDDEVAVEVRDEGPGIGAEDRERVFERFYQTPLGVEVGGGTGIGLALVRDLVELHQGRITLESEPGTGAAFRVVLPRLTRDSEFPSSASGVGSLLPSPVVEGGSAEVAPPPSDRQGGGGAGPDDADRASPPLVLVVEDNVELRAFLVRYLSRHFRIAEAPDGATGLEVARGASPDVVVSDVMMPGLDGFGLLRGLRADPELESVPVVLLTARAEVEDRVEGLECGADDYLGKPFAPRELTARVRALIEGRQRLRRALLREGRAPAVDGDGGAPPVRDGGPTAVDATPPAPDPGEALRARLLAALEERLGDPGFGVNELAASVAMERTGLYRLMSETLGTTPSDFLREVRMNRAAELLKDGHTVSEVAYGVGYGSVSSFSRRFQERFGSRPGGWAREQRGASA